MVFSVAIKFLIVATFLGVVHNPVECLNFNFTVFSESTRPQLIWGDTSIMFERAIQVTPDVNGANMTRRSGRILYGKPFRLWNRKGFCASFNTTFVINIKPQTTPGGEGLAFILTGSSLVNIHADGQWLGIVEQQKNGSSLAQTVAIEFDTRKSYQEDVDDNHVGLDVNSVYSRVQFSLTNLGVRLSSGKNITVHVQYDGELQKVAVFLEDVNRSIIPVFSEIIDLSDYLPQNIYLGFSGSTSNYTQLNCLRSWAFNGDAEEDDNPFWIWIVVPVLGVALLFGAAFAFYWKRNIDREMEDAYPSIEEAIQVSSNAPRKFKLKELRKATGNFSPKNKLGKGGFGTVYKGVMENKDIAVKKVSKESTQGKTEFIAEVTTIGKLHHRNLVKLIGWCYERREFLLVYEFLPNGSLDKFIFYDEKSSMEESTISWETRLSITTGAAQALDYLHNGCEETILHRDIKSSNIMLDSEFNAKLGDFGLARSIKLGDQTHHSTKELAGTPGYMAPDSILTGRFTVETDVYAFGILILEVACGRKPAGSHPQQDDYSSNIVHWVWSLYRKGKILNAADSRLNGDFPAEDMECMLILGLACCNPNPHVRPSMKRVLQVLKGEAAVPPVPSDMPAFMWPPLPPSFQEVDMMSLGQLTPFSEISGR